MRVEAEVLSATETAMILRVKLGILKAWPSFLADCIRDRQSLYGHQLQPWASLHVSEAVIGRPLYRREDVDVFVAKVLCAGGIKAAAPTIRPTRVIVENAPGVPWRMRRAERVKPPSPAP
jgi:hypothetical protein